MKLKRLNLQAVSQTLIFTTKILPTCDSKFYILFYLFWYLKKLSINHINIGCGCSRIDLRGMRYLESGEVEEPNALHSSKILFGWSNQEERDRHVARMREQKRCIGGET